MKGIIRWKNAKEEVQYIPIEKIVSSPYQPRSRYDLQEIAGLAASLATYGVLSPLIVRRIRGGFYEVIAGERRLRACQRLEMKTVPVLVRSLKESEVSTLLLSERLQQCNLSAIERAEAYDRLLRETDYTPRDLAKALGVSASEVTEPMEYLHLSAETRRVMEEYGIDGEQMQEAMKEPKKEQKILFSVLQSEFEEKAKNDRLPAQEVYGNTIQKTVGMLNLAGATADSERVEKDDCIEYIIRIPK